jgi:hypothetical protein
MNVAINTSRLFLRIQTRIYNRCGVLCRSATRELFPVVVLFFIVGSFRHTDYYNFKIYLRLICDLTANESHTSSVRRTVDFRYIGMPKNSLKRNMPIPVHANNLSDIMP